MVLKGLWGILAAVVATGFASGLTPVATTALPFKVRLGPGDVTTVWLSA